jgi:hypothetical protein
MSCCRVNPGERRARKVFLIRRLGVPALTALCAAGVWAQTAPAGKNDQSFSSPPGQTEPAATLSVQVKVVNVLATVRDKHGKIVNSLTKDDFTLTEDGRPQTIHYFTRDGPATHSRAPG